MQCTKSLLRDDAIGATRQAFLGTLQGPFKSEVVP